MLDLLSGLGIPAEPLLEGGHLPMRIVGGDWAQRVIEVGQTQSSQFLSAMLLVGASLPEGVELRLQAPPTSAPYLRLTVAELRAWGVPVETSYGTNPLVRISVSGAALAAQRRQIPVDASSALFWGAAAAIVPSASVALPGLDLSDGQPDAAAFDVLAQMGVRIETTAEAVVLRGPKQLTSAGLVNCANMPDATPALAVVACFAEAPTRLTGLKTLRVKESDRVATIAGELQRAGADVTVAGEDDLIVTPRALSSDPVTIQTWDDHRIAMALAVFGLRRGGISIADPGCVNKSYPGFWGDLGRFAAEPQPGDTA